MANNSEITDKLVKFCAELLQTAEFNKKVTFRYKVINTKVNTDKNYLFIERSIQGMASEQTVPEIPKDPYITLLSELDEVQESLKNVHEQLDKILIKSQLIEQKLHEINKVEKIVRKYNNLS